MTVLDIANLPSTSLRERLLPGFLWIRQGYLARALRRGLGPLSQATISGRCAQAEAQAIALVTDAVGATGSSAQYLIAQRYLESLTQIAANPQKIVFPAVRSIRRDGVDRRDEGALRPGRAAPRPEAPSLSAEVGGFGETRLTTIESIGPWS